MPTGVAALRDQITPIDRSAGARASAERPAHELDRPDP